jgi:creatinine amidohydrolase
MGFYLHHKSWKVIGDELKDSDIVIVPLGALEAHGIHKPVGTCYLLAESVSRDIGEKTGIPVTPTIPFGVSDAYKNFPGTITVSSKALTNYMEDICASLIRSGFKKIVFFSAHGGNNLSVLRELSGKLRKNHKTLCVVLHLWGLVPKLAPQDFWESGFRLGHGGEPSTSVMLHLYPDLVDMSKAAWRPLNQPMEGFESTTYGTHWFKGIPLSIPLLAEEVTDSSAQSNPTVASKEKGKILYNRLIEYLIEFLDAFKKLEPSLS